MDNLMTRSLFVFAIALSISVSAFAQDKKAEAPKESVVQAQAADEKNTPITKWVAAENALIDPLSDKDKASFFILRNKHSIIRVIRVVERDVGSAVKACGDNNKDMKEGIDARFRQWQNAVDPILDTAQKQLDKDLKAQKLVDAKEAKRVLKLNDEAYEYGEKQITKRPVTSKEACENLVRSMDRTEDEMISLLQETLLPESVIRDRAERMEREEAEKLKEQKAPEADKSFARKPKS